MEIISLHPFRTSPDALSNDSIQSLLVEDIYSGDGFLPYDKSIHGSNPLTSTSLRNRQWDVLRHLLFKAGIEAPLVYNSSGKPIITAGPHISVTHTGNAMLLSIGNRNHGVDMEAMGIKASKVKQRFCSEIELDWAEKTGNENIYTMIWCAKEAMFKYFGEKVDFRKELFIEPAETHSSLIYGTYNGIHGQHRFLCDVYRHNELCILHAMRVK